MALDRAHFRSLIRELEQVHGTEQGVRPAEERFAFHVWFDDGAEYCLRWRRKVANADWQVVRER